MKDLQCPYCEHDIDLKLDDGFGYDEDVKWEYECPSCEKSLEEIESEYPDAFEENLERGSK